MALVEKVLGVSGIDELKLLDPDEVEQIIAIRLEHGLWKPQRGAPPFIFLVTTQGRYPQWEQEFIKLAGEAAAERMAADTQKTYSYRVDVAR